MYPRKKNRASGFTLVELLVVVIILAVLASIVVPQFSSSTTDAREAALDATIGELRNAIELYYHQHGGTYPGAAAAGGTYGAADSDSAMINQLTKYTAADGTVSETKTATAKYGPYLKKPTFPNNPIDDDNSIVISTSGDLSDTGTDAGGWWFDVNSGKLLANIATHYNR